MFPLMQSAAAGASLTVPLLMRKMAVFLCWYWLSKAVAAHGCRNVPELVSSSDRQSISMIVIRNSNLRALPASIWMVIKLEGGHQHWYHEIGKYLLYVFVLIHPDVDRSHLNAFSLCPQDQFNETKNQSYFIVVLQYCTSGCQFAAVTVIM